MELAKEILGIIATTSGAVIICIIASFLIYGFNFICSKLGITINNSTMTEILAIVSQVIKYLDQKFVDTIKTNSTDGKLTEYQQELVKTKCLDMIKAILNSEQVDFLLKKYNMDNIDDILDILIESNIKDSRNGNSDETIIINENDNQYISSVNNEGFDVTDFYTPTEEEITSLSICQGNCEKCTLFSDCKIHRS